MLRDPEDAHDMVLRLLTKTSRSKIWSKVLQALFAYENEKLQTRCFGLDFKKPVGLAAGFDKNAILVRAVSLLGFGFSEVGAITPRAQIGNPRPRLFRLVRDEALINYMGFNNDGAEVIGDRLRNLGKADVPLGINIGKGKDTPQDSAVEDYIYVFEKLYPYADYFSVNVSSPGTPNLRELQEKDRLNEILKEISLRNTELADQLGMPPKPILVKIAPDLTFSQIDEVLEVAEERQIQGIIATNTTVGREVLRTKININMPGGLSGRPLREKSTDIIRHIYKNTKGGLKIIGVGGIFGGKDAYEKIRAGASLVQLYTGFIYEGPGLIKKINKELVKFMDADDFKNISEAVGTASL